ncbi:UNVERIFIED_CONTAM: Kinesin-like protein KIN-14P [Sesamum calycinum]|uniref:Kinesin-like protein KIN-14P n=1 Tax=Sesamum calycinum TaxID=2727403 RepID=A0AAW2LY76_9LAMI
MDPQSEVRVSENRELDGLSEVRNGNVSGRIEAFNGLAEGHNFSGVLKSKRVHHADVPALKISELMKLGNLELLNLCRAHSLFSTVNRILDECIEKSNQDIPQRVASVLKLVVQEIEQRVTKQADNMRKSGPNASSVADWGVNYRALNDLFNISQKRHGSIAYEIGVQMVEIYNEQVRDLLCPDSSQKRYPSELLC